MPGNERDGINKASSTEEPARNRSTTILRNAGNSRSSTAIFLDNNLSGNFNVAYAVRAKTIGESASSLASSTQATVMNNRAAVAATPKDSEKNSAAEKSMRASLSAASSFFSVTCDAHADVK